MDGIVNVNKPIGITSHGVVYRLRKILNMKKIGHTGTLDPDAEGVLPMCIGKGTKIAEELTAKEKQYLAELTLGVVTDTQDMSGEVLETKEVSATVQEIEDAVMSFVGEIMQTPPMYSAIKIGGKKLYELAREGKTAEIPPRPVTIHKIEIKNIENNKVTFLVDCGKGTYIRTLCHDIGQKLGCGGAMSALKRTRSGDFCIEDSYTLEQIAEMAEREDFSFLKSIDSALSKYDRLVLADKNAKKLCNGVPVRIAGLEDGKVFRVYDEEKKFLALSKAEEGYLKTVRAFFGEGPI